MAERLRYRTFHVECGPTTLVVRARMPESTQDGEWEAAACEQFVRMVDRRELLFGEFMVVTCGSKPSEDYFADDSTAPHVHLTKWHMVEIGPGCYIPKPDGRSDQPHSRLVDDKHARWRCKNQDAGLCPRCGKKAAPWRWCPECRGKRREQRRARDAKRR